MLDLRFPCAVLVAAGSFSCSYDWDQDGKSAALPSGAASGSTGASGASSSGPGAGSGGDGGSAAAASSSGATSASTSGSGGEASSPCPAAQPEGPCGDLTSTCEYGDDPRPHCRTRVSCQEGTWTVTQSCESCPALNPAACPDGPEPGLPEDGCEPGILCTFERGTLSCGCGEGGWSCGATPSDGCPEGAPLLGHVCRVPGQTCTYGSCDIETQIERVCSDGVWVQGDVCVPEPTCR